MATETTAAITVGVGLSELMAVNAVSFGSVSGCWSLPPQDVDLEGYRLKMAWPDTGPVSAQMIQREPLGYWAHQLFVGNAMRENCFAFDLQGTIAAASVAAHPQPTIVGFLNERPKLFVEGKSRLPEGRAMISPPLIMHITPAARPNGTTTIRDGTLGLHRKVTPFVAVQPEVYRLAAASIIHSMETC